MFNFNNLFIIGEKKEIDDSNYEYNLGFCTIDEELNEISAYVWDDEEALLKWKAINAAEESYCAMDFRSFFDIFILKNSADIKWILLNPPPEVANYKTAERKGINRLNLFSALGSWPVFEYFLSEQGYNDDTRAMVKQLASENSNMMPNEFLSNLSELIEKKTSSIVTTRSDEEKFENDFKLKHVVISDIKYWDNEKNKNIQAKLDLFGHCFQVTTTADKRVIKGTSNPDDELKYEAMPIEESNDYIVEIQNNGSMIFIMSSKKLEALKQHYHAMNKSIPALRESFKNNVNSIVSQLLDDSELVEMGKRFVNELPIGFYTDISQLIVIEFIIDKVNSHLGKLLLLSNKELRDLFLKENLDNIEKYNNEAVAYLGDMLVMFTQIIKEKIAISDSRQEFFVTYVFIYNIVIEYLAKKWENEYSQYFQDIRDLDLDEAIERYCSIETIVHFNDVSVGNFIYYLIKYRKFEQNNRNYLICREIFIPKLNRLLEKKKYNNFVNRLKKPNISSQTKYSISDVDLMNGQEFEAFIAELFSKMGYESEITKTSGDQGIDVIASKNGNTIGIQAKCYSGSVGNSAIQEVVAGRNYYRLDKAIVVTNNFFTDAAQQLAHSNSIILWDRNILKEKIDEFFNSSQFDVNY